MDHVLHRTLSTDGMGSVHSVDELSWDGRAWPRHACELRWAVDIRGWRPTSAEWALLLGLLSSAERLDVCAARCVADRKRALVSRLLQRRCIAEALAPATLHAAAPLASMQLSPVAVQQFSPPPPAAPASSPPASSPPASAFASAVIRRTRGGKPFEASGLPRPPGAENFNFNVSHEGNLVALASDGGLLIGKCLTARFCFH